MPVHRFSRFVTLLVARSLYRITARGLENLPADGGALLVSNHVASPDACLVAATLKRPVRFLMPRDSFENRLLRPLFKLMKSIPIASGDTAEQKHAALNAASESIKEGGLVCIFAEGARTRNGNLASFIFSPEAVAGGTRLPIIPVHIGGAWGRLFSCIAGPSSCARTHWGRTPVSVLFGKPLPPESSGSEVRQAILELSCESVDLQKDKLRTLPRQFIATARRHSRRWMLSDTTGKRLSFGKALAAAIALAKEIRHVTGDAKTVGLLLPSSVGSALANYAISLNGQIAVNLNFTVSRESIICAIRQADIKTILSSRAFLEQVGDFGITGEIVCLEDIVDGISAGRRGIAFLKSLLAPARFIIRNAPAPDDVAAILFSSGSTGQPKGVMLSHHNLVSNIESFTTVIAIKPGDRMCASLPFFHSFGFTTNLWGPAISGYSAAFHHNPLEGAKIAEIVRREKLTILLATPTFLLTYIRRAKRDDFRSLRAVITGAEKLHENVAAAFEKRFGIRPLEGYGTTELSPVVSVNLPDVEFEGVTQVGTKHGSIGHPIPGVATTIVHSETGKTLPENAEGLLHVKGPNVMLGYLNNSEMTESVLRDGWYNTGDIARIDEDGFIFILDRASRYSKIGGEMVPHMAIEDDINRTLSILNRELVVTSATDSRKGEQLVVCYTEEAGELADLQKAVTESDLPNLWKPRKDNFLKLKEVPHLASGKLDLRKIRQIAQEFVDQRPGRLQRTVDALRRGL